MGKVGKNYKKSREQVDPDTNYSLEKAFELLDKVHFAKFDETVDVAFRLGVDPKHADQMVRGAVALPNGTGKEVTVLVFAKGEKEAQAKEAGADYVGSDDLVEKIKGGWMEFDTCIASPDMMATVSKIGKVLGPRGLMPNPKSGTVTQDVAKAVQEAKSGRVEYRVEKSGIVHAPIGKISFGPEKLKGNFMALLESLQRAKPATAKGKYYRTLALSTTMSPAVWVDINEIEQIVN